MTAYLREACSVEIPFNEKTGKSKGFTFVTALDQIRIKLQKLNGIEFHGNKVLSQESTLRKRSNPVRTEISNTSDSQNLVNTFPEIKYNREV